MAVNSPCVFPSGSPASGEDCPDFRALMLKKSGHYFQLSPASIQRVIRHQATNRQATAPDSALPALPEVDVTQAWPGRHNDSARARQRLLSIISQACRDGL